MSTWLIDTALYTAILIALVLLLRQPVARTFGPTIAYALWALPLLRFLLPPLVLPASLAPVSETAPVALDSSTLAMLLATEEMNAAAVAAVAPPAWAWSDLILPLWLGSAALFLAWRMWNYRRMRRELLAGAKPVGEAGKVRLVETPAVASPIAFGVFDKVVALPPRFMALEDRHARDLAIAHELAHHAGHDIAANFAAQPLLALHWFNPLAWLGWRAMRRDQEAACDARVLAGRDRTERAAYANLLAAFAARPRLALAAPMACPILGEKSIIHRLRSLSMSDVSRRRRIAGRLLLGAATLALPLTASVSYAQGESVEEVELAQSAVATADESAAQVNRQVRSVRSVADENDVDAAAAPDGDADPKPAAAPRFDDEKRAFNVRNGHPLTDEQLQELREMGKRFEDRDWEQFAKRQEEFARRQEEVAKRHEEFAKRQEELAERMAARMAAEAPIVETRCGEEETPIRNSIDADGRQRIAICERAIERQALRSAAVSLRQTRESIARNRALNAEIRNEILQDLDKEIERIERERRDS